MSLFGVAHSALAHQIRLVSLKHVGRLLAGRNIELVLFVHEFILVLGNPSNLRRRNVSDVIIELSNTVVVGVADVNLNVFLLIVVKRTYARWLIER